MRRGGPIQELDVDAARRILDETLGSDTPKRGRISKSARLQELRPQITALRARSYSWADIAALLKDVGAGNKDTLRYAMETKAGHKKKRKAAQKLDLPKDEAPTPVAAAPAPKANLSTDEHAATRRAGWKA